MNLPISPTCSMITEFTNLLGASKFYLALVGVTISFDHADVDSQDTRGVLNYIAYFLLLNGLIAISSVVLFVLKNLFKFLCHSCMNKILS